MGGNKHPDFVIVFFGLIYDPLNLSFIVSFVDLLKDFLLVLALDVGHLLYLLNPPRLDIA